MPQLGSGMQAQLRAYILFRVIFFPQENDCSFIQDVAHKHWVLQDRFISSLGQIPIFPIFFILALTITIECSGNILKYYEEELPEAAQDYFCSFGNFFNLAGIRTAQVLFASALETEDPFKICSESCYP